MSTVKKIVRGASTRIVTYPVRVLIIINSVIFPILLGVIIFLIMKFTKPVMDVITKAKSIEKLVEDNIHLGISKVKELYNQGKQVFVDYARDSLVHMLDLKNIVDDSVNLGNLKGIISTAFTDTITNDFNTDSILDFVKDHDMINNILDEIIDGINNSNIVIDDKTKDIIINAINEIKSHGYTITQFITHHELMVHT
jgi:hypothetical protein